MTSAGKTVLKLTVAGVAVVINTSTTPGVWTSKIQYLLTDHLGSVDVITDTAGAVVENGSIRCLASRRLRIQGGPSAAATALAAE